MEPSIKNTFLLISIFPMLTLSYPNGEVQDSCSTMIPGHGFAPQTSTAPYSLDLISINYTGKAAILVTLRKAQGGGDFKGFMMQARAPGGNVSLGTFVINSSDVHTLTCGTPDSAVSHNSNSFKSSVHAIWIPPNTRTDTQFRATVVASHSTYWINVFSDILPVASAGCHFWISALFQLLICSSSLIFAMFVK